MIFYTGWGWLVALIWLSAVCASGHISPQLIEHYISDISRVTVIFLLAAAISSPLLSIAGLLLNRTKFERTIYPLGRKKTVYWGAHTFYLLPIEHWAVVIPVTTLIVFVFSSFI